MPFIARMRKPNVLSRNTSLLAQHSSPSHTNTLTTTHAPYHSHTRTYVYLKFSCYQQTRVRLNVIVKLTRRDARPVLWDPLHRNGLITTVNSRGLANITKPLKSALPSSQIKPDHLWENPQQLCCRAHCVQNANKQKHCFCPHGLSYIPTIPLVNPETILCFIWTGLPSDS